MIYNKTDVARFLKKYSNQEIVYCANPGNAGDAMIAHATYQLFDKLNIRPQIIRHNEIVYDKIIIYGGGGNLVEGKYNQASQFINNNYRQNREIIILPHTVYGYDELLLAAHNLTIFCREKISYQNLSAIGYPAERLFLAHDMVFQLAKTEFQEFVRTGVGTANCLRTDQESTRTFDIPSNNLDISLSWKGQSWHRPDFAKNVTHSLACYLSAYETVNTDRLHVAILAGILGKKVVLFPNIYYKIKAVYEHSMKDAFDNVSFIENLCPDENPLSKIQINELQLKRKNPEEHMLAEEQRIIDMNFLTEQLKGVLESKSWKVTKPLRDLMKMLRRSKK